MIKLPAYYISTPYEGVIKIDCSNGETFTTADYHVALDFLVNVPANVPKELPRIAWNLAESMAIIKTMLPPGKIEEIEGRDHRATWEEGEQRYRIYYLAGKLLGIHAGRHGDEITLYELDQFFPNNLEINGVEDVKKYVDELVVTLQSLGVGAVKSLKSPVAVIEESGLLDKIYQSFPSPASIPSGCAEYAVMSDAWGAWCSAYQVGYWQEAYSYDIASAYPAVASRLITLDGARYEYSKKMLPDAAYGFIRGAMTINPDHPFAYCNPIVAPIDNDLGNPVGRLPKDYYTLGKIRFIENNGMGSFEIDKRSGGWFIYPKVDNGYPLARIMQHYYARRIESPLMSMLCKRIIAGIIGRMGQYKANEPTMWTNPVYHSYIRNTASLMVGQALIKHAISSEELVHVNTDGFHATRQLDIPREARMGQWKSEGANQLLVLSPDVMYEDEKCKPLLDAIKLDKSSSVYNDRDLWQLAGSQNRYFPNYPLTGGALLQEHYQSKAIVC